MPDAARGLRVLVGDARGRPLAAAGLARWLRRAAPPRARGTVSIALVSDQRVRALNRTYRRKDAATDGLSFPAFDPPPAANTQRPRGRFLGDIVIACGVAKRQAHALGHDEATEIRVLALHGLLHLLGYDHERDNGEMLRVERRLRRRAGLRESLTERGSRGSRGSA
jgi:probable rRNA maturation factor